MVKSSELSLKRVYKLRSEFSKAKIIKDIKKKKKLELTDDDKEILNTDTNLIRNAVLKSEIKQRQKVLKQILKSERRNERRRLGIEPMKPLFQEDMRVKDDTILEDKVKGKEDDEDLKETIEAMKVEIKKEEECDEFDNYFKNLKTPKVMITIGMGVGRKTDPVGETKFFVNDLLHLIPNSFFYKRQTYRLKEIVDIANENEFTDILVVGQRNRKPTSLIHIHLPSGPTATYRLSEVVSHKFLDKDKRAEFCNYNPEVIVNHFTTRLGTRVGRMLSVLFPQKPEFNARHVVTFHNQRDFVFFRHHRYEFDRDGTRCNLQEVGPRFTLRLERLQLGTFDTKFGQFEWYCKPEHETSRRKFFL